MMSCWQDAADDDCEDDAEDACADVGVLELSSGEETMPRLRAAPVMSRVRLFAVPSCSLA